MRSIFKTLLFFFLLSIFPAMVFSQTVEQSAKLQQLSIELREKFEKQQEIAKAKAQRLGFPLKHRLPDGTSYELVRFNNELPVYYMSANGDGATLINTDKVYSGGGANLSLSGINQIIGLWDESIPLTTHQEFQDNSTSRISTGLHSDGGGSAITHATRVAGTLIASGVDSEAKGMAFAGKVNAYNWTNDLTEMSAAAGDQTTPLRVSVHPYQTTAGWIQGQFDEFSEFDSDAPSGWYWFGDKSQSESFYFGYYDETARDWDNVAYQATNYLIVASAGNHRGIEPPSGTSTDDIYLFDDGAWKSLTTLGVQRPVKDGGSNGFDSLAGFNLSKNVLSVGAINETDLSFFANSSWGPTDDGRIKPDVVAKGVDVKSPTAVNNSDYSEGSGTSFSAPMIAGSASLLLEHQENLHPGETLLSSTLRGLISHTATDLGSTGPDYKYGWGLMNTQKATEVMSDNADNNHIHIRELSIRDGQTLTFQIKANGSEPLRSTIAWTDPPVALNDIISFGTLNDRTSRLVNDLDIRLTDNTSEQFQPFTLNPGSPNTNAAPGDNTVDNIEIVHIENPAPGDLYTVTISHKGATLEGGKQDFSLIVTGNESIDYQQQIAEGNGEGWRFLSSPIPATTYGDLLSTIWTQGPLNSNDESAAVSNSNVMLFDGNNYVMPSDLSSTIPKGSGAAVFVFVGDKNKTLSVNGLENIGDVILDDLLHPSTNGSEVYTLLGNPFNSTIDFDGDGSVDNNGFIKNSNAGNVVYVYDHACGPFSDPDEPGGTEGGCFRAWNGSTGSLADGLIAPFQGFFVYSTGSNPTLTIPESSKTSGGTFYKDQKNQTPVMQIAARINGEYSGETWLSFTETGSIKKNSYDAPYLYPLDYRPFLSLQTRFDGTGYNIKNLPAAPETSIEIPLVAEAWEPDQDEQSPGYRPLTGNIELIWPKMENLPSEWAVTLTDHHLGKIINMKTQGRYEYTTSPQKQAERVMPYKMELQKAVNKQTENSRFTITVSPNGESQITESNLPEAFELHQNYPNPFNPTTVIRYDLPENAEVTLDVYSVNGQRVATLVNQNQQAGSYTVPFDASRLASGVYIYQLKAGNFLSTQKMVLLK